MSYLTQPITARTGITVSDVAEQCSTAPFINMGEASYDLYLVLQGSAVVWRVQGQYSLLAKGDWGFASLVCYICSSFEATVPLTVDARCSYLSIPLG